MKIHYYEYAKLQKFILRDFTVHNLGWKNIFPVTDKESSSCASVQDMLYLT